MMMNRERFFEHYMNEDIEKEDLIQEYFDYIKAVDKLHEAMKVIDETECPECGEEICEGWNEFYCGKCGKKLDWRKDDE